MDLELQENDGGVDGHTTCAANYALVNTSVNREAGFWETRNPPKSQSCDFPDDAHLAFK